MFERIKIHITTATMALTSHRALYAGLAGAYGGLCFGMDKDVIQQIITALYLTLVAKG